MAAVGQELSEWAGQHDIPEGAGLQESMGALNL